MRGKSEPPVLVTPRLLGRWPLPELGAGSDKQSRGTLLVAGGSRSLPGAVLLAGTAALRVGAGRVRIATAASAALAVGVAFPEAAVLGLPETRGGELAPGGARSIVEALEPCRVLVVGPGMRDEALVRRLLRGLRRGGAGCALVLDAAALRVLAGRRPFERGALGPVIATPHAGEMAELWGCSRADVEAAPLELAREAARTLGVTLVLKGQQTLIVGARGSAYLNRAGNAGLATAGSGDVLSGIVGGLLARGADPVQAAVWAVSLHARAGEALARAVGPLGYLARELGAELPALMAAPGRRQPPRTSTRGARSSRRS